MKESLVKITYKTADGDEFCIEVSASVKELLEQSDRKFRSQRRQDRRYIDYYIDSIEDLISSNTVASQEITDLVIATDRTSQLNTAVSRLTQTQQRRLHLHFVEDLSHRQIAEMEGVNRAAIAQSIKRALRQLHKHLTD